MQGLGISIRNASIISFIIFYLISLLFVLQLTFPGTIPPSIPLFGVVVWWISFIAWLLVDMRKYQGDRIIGSAIIACMAPWVFVFLFAGVSLAGAKLSVDVLFSPVWVSLAVMIGTALTSLVFVLWKRKKPKGSYRSDFVTFRIVGNDIGNSFCTN